MKEKSVDITSTYPKTMTQHTNVYQYQEIVETLFNERLKVKETNPDLVQMYTILINIHWGLQNND